MQYTILCGPIINNNNWCCLFVLSLRTRRLDKVDHGWVRSDLNRAFQVWSKHSKLTFREVNSESADILVFFEKWVLVGFVRYLYSYTLCSARCIIATCIYIPICWAGKIKIWQKRYSKNKWNPNFKSKLSFL